MRRGHAGADVQPGDGVIAAAYRHRHEAPHGEISDDARGAMLTDLLSAHCAQHLALSTRQTTHFDDEHTWRDEVSARVREHGLSTSPTADWVVAGQPHGGAQERCTLPGSRPRLQLVVLFGRIFVVALRTDDAATRDPASAERVLVGTARVVERRSRGCSWLASPPVGPQPVAGLRRATSGGSGST